MAQNLTFNLGVETGSAVTSINQFFSAFDQGAAKAKSTLNTAFNQKLETEVEINLKNGELVAKEIQKASQESKRLETAAKAINGEFGKTPASLRKQVTVLKQIQSNTQKFSSTTGKLSDDWKLVTQRIQEASQKLQTMTQGGPLERMKNSLQGIVGKFTLVQTLSNLATSAIQGFAASGQEFLNMAGRMEVLQLQLEAFTGGTEQAEAAFKEFARIASNSPFSLEQVAEAAKIMMAFGVDTDVAIEATEQLGVVAAATGGDINLLARNLGQIAAQGQAYTRDLTQFAIQGIPIWEEMSRVTGASVTELKAMASEGKISFDIVSAALNSLTADGTKFAEVAVRMQETFQGRMAKIASSINELALAFINTFNDMDRALGGIISGSMKAFADGIVFLAEHMNEVASAIAAMTAATVAYFAISKWYVIAEGIALVFGFIKKLLTTQMALNAAKAFFVSLSVGGLIKVAAAAGSAAIAYKVVNDAINKAGDDTGELTGKTGELTAATGDLTEKELEHLEAVKDTHKEQMATYDDALQARDELKAKLDLEIERLKAMKEVVKERYDKEIEAIEQVLAKDKEKQEEMKVAHQEAMSQVEERHAAAMDALDAELGRLREKTQAEEELYAYQKQQLEAKIRSGELEGEELLQAKARLSRMERQEEIQQVLNEKAALKVEQEKEIAELTKEQNTQMGKLTDKIKDQEKEISLLKDKRDEEVKAINEAIKASKNMTKAVSATSDEVDDQIGLVKSLAGQYATASARADDLAASLRAAATAQRALNAASSGSGGGPSRSARNRRFAGGPVSGGSTYTVNELGKEAFLSASGQLSMIKAPAFGDWRAPGSGTVIPAHLTKQLNVPTGGVQLNRGAASRAVGAGGSSDISRMMSAIAGTMGGDTISNNVTIQSANPRQTASDVMVQLAKLKRLRYN